MTAIRSGVGHQKLSDDDARLRAARTWAESFGTVVKVGLEGSGSYGTGLMRFLTDYGLTVVGVDRPDRSTRRRVGKTDTIDYTVEDHFLPLPQQVAEIFARTCEAFVSMRIWPALNLRINIHFFSEDEVVFDFDRDDLQGQHQLDLLCYVMRSLGRHLGKASARHTRGHPSTL